MRKRSKIIETLKQEEIQRARDLSPCRKIDLQIAHSEFIRSIFGAGLLAKGFTREQVDRLWKD